MNKRQVILCSLVIAGLLTACATTPTGRKQLRIVPESQLVVMGVQSFHEIQAKTPVVKDGALTQYVRCVADKITQLPRVRKQSTDWEVQVFDEATVNAFALPGGKIGVYAGLLNVAKTPDQLAAVLGHEVGHVLANHGNERVSQQFALNQTITLLDGWMQQGNKKNRDLAMATLGLGGQFGILLPFSRLHESEADDIGQSLMAQAGFDPRESVALWQNMASASKGAPPEFMSTHPSHETRIDNLTSGLKKQVAVYQQAIAKDGKPSCTPPR